MKIYVINLEMSSPNQLISSERLDEMARKLNFKFKEETRKQIHAVNQRYKSNIYFNTLDFHGLHICKEEQLPGIISESDKAHEEMTKIDSSLRATLAYFTLNMAEVAKGETYGQVLSAIRYQVIKEVLDRIDKMTENKAIDQLNGRSKQALVKMVERLKAINILNDKDVDKKLETIKTAILTDSIAPMKKELIDEVTALTSGGAYLRFKEHGGDAPAPAPVPQKEVS